MINNKTSSHYFNSDLQNIHVSSALCHPVTIASPIVLDGDHYQLPVGRLALYKLVKLDVADVGNLVSAAATRAGRVTQQRQTQRYRTQRERVDRLRRAADVSRARLRRRLLRVSGGID